MDYELRPDPQSVREERVNRARAAMREAGIDCLLLWKNENVRYLTGLRAQLIAGKSALLNGCILLEDRPPILLLSGGEIDRCRMVMPWIAEMLPIPIMEARDLVRCAVRTVIAPTLRAHGLRDGSVLGLDEAAMCQIAALGELLPGVTLADGDAPMQQARRIKSRSELAVMQEACAIAEAVTQSAIDAVQPGVRELDVVAQAMHTLFRLGGEEAHVTTPFVASGEHMAPPNRIASEKIIRDGDLVFIDIGAQWGGYFGDIGRTVVCGEPSPMQQRVYTAVYDALAAATRAMRAGNSNRDVELAVQQAAAAHGLADRMLGLFIGHGVGMGANEPPYIGERAPGAETVILQEGMVFAVEPLIWVPDVPGGGGVRLEDTIVVEAGGGRALTRTRFEAQLLEGERPARRHDPAQERSRLA